jgi:hypothetical protein
VAAIAEAVGSYRRFAGARPAAYEPDPATSLAHLGSRLSELGRREEALAATVEAVGIRRRLTDAYPGVYEPAVALSLDHLGSRLLELGRREEAAATIAEAVDIRRRLAADPAANGPDLASGS